MAASKGNVSISQLFSYADGVDKLLVLLGTLGSIGDGLMTPLTMLVLSGMINDYGSADISFSNHVVDKYALRLLYVAVAVGGSAFMEGACWTTTAERQASVIRREYLKSVLRQDVGFFDTQAGTSTTYQVVSTISSDVNSIQDVLSEKIPNFLAHVSSFVSCLTLAFILSWRLALAVLPFSLMFIIPGVAFGKHLMRLGTKMKDAYGVAGGIAEQAVSSIRTVFSYVGELQTLEGFSQELQRSMELGIKQGFTKGLMIGSMGMIFATWAFESWVGSMLVIERGERGGPIFIAGICIILGGLSVMNAMPNITFFANATAAASRIFEMINQLPAIDSEDENGKILASVRGELEFKDVTFSYPSRPETLILEGFNLNVPAGKRVGLVGSSGSGKSTVISLLQRFYDPVEGDIILDGNKIKKLQLKWLRSQMGLVNQEPVLFATSIKENILFGMEGASMELVVDAAKAANAHDFISKLPDGYETQVGQFGVQLSGGQKQRIAIARALIRDPRILLLDEATSALDAESERTVQEALEQASAGRTTIVIAHRLSTIRRSDLILVLQSGKVIESGSHEELIQINNKQGGTYSRMVELQQKAMQNEALSPNLQTKNDLHNRMVMSSPNPVNMRSSRQNSPAYFSPTYSVSAAYSFIKTPYHDDPDEKNFNLSAYPPPSQWRLLQMNAPEWKRALLGCLGAIGFGAIQTTNAYCLGSVASVYFLKDNDLIKSKTKFYCLIFLSIAVLSFIANLLQHYNFAIMGERLTKRVREKMLKKVLTFEIGWFDQDENTSAAICARLATEANMVRSLVGDRISLLVQVFAGASLACVLALVVTWRLASVMIAMQPFLICCFYSRSVLMKRMSEKAREAQNEGSQLASEAVVNHRTITAFSSQKRILGLFETTQRGPHKESVKQAWFAAIGLFSSQFLTTASIALSYWYGGRLITQNLITSKHLFQAFFILMSTGKNIADAGSMTSDLAKGADAIRSIFAILDRKSEIEPDDPEGVEPTKVLTGHIELKNVFFSYPARPDQMIFKGLSLKIEAGKTVALVGESGSGKSTIISLIERFYDPINGSIEIDKKDIKLYNLRALRSHIALVSQEPTLFAGTIRENIVYGKQNVTEAELKQAAIFANAHEFISSMENGYETYCGERGVQLSGGQKQRIALARAILKNPAILLLDEATSALDSVSENLVQEALEKMMVGRTCVVVAHRLSTIQKSDSIAVIKNGIVAEQGSHSNLLAIGHGGSYYSLMKLQGSNTPYR
ncbi:ABC transporter [Macleaya cordata]|uniref:ABC transporter n=1 Tax=Macleaya cordata TaxID=56857 RepID=A0A200R4I7_MACCD|nr:ABC transporter [Macleaya cordata]